MKKIKVTDANGKDFEISMSDITDMTTDLEGEIRDHAIEDAEAHNMMNFTPSIVDSQGNAVDVNKILDSAKTDKSKLPQAIDVTFEATHSGQNRNSFVYHSDSMAEDAASWKAPYPKPFLKNHDIYSEPMGRVVDFMFGQSEFNPNRDTINVTYRINDADAIEKFLDGRYKTMSIGGSVGHITCGICGKEILKDGAFKFCGHWKGEIYNGQKAVWNGRKIEYKEGSVVNAPADDWAQVKKIALVEQNSNSKDGEDMSKPNVTKDSEENILDAIDNLAGQDKPEGTTEDANKTPEGAEGTTDGEASTTEPTAQDNEGEGAEGQEETLDSVKAERDALKDANTALETDKAALEGKVSDLEAEIQSLKDQVSSLTEESKANAEDAQAQRQQSIKLAVMNKKLMAQRVVDFELIGNKLEDAKKDERLTELVGKSAKELTDMVNNLAVDTVKTQRQMATQVPNPGLVDPKDSNTVQGEEEVKDNQTTKTPEPSMKDFEDTIIGLITRK